MRIAIVHPGMNFKGGAENIVVWLAQGLARMDHEVTVVAEVYDPGLWDPALVKDLKVRLFPPFRLSRLLNSKVLRMWERRRQLGRMLKGYDLVVCQHFPSYCWAAEGRIRTQARWRLVWLCQEPLRRLYTEVTDAHLNNYEHFTPEGVENDHLDEDRTKRRYVALRRKGKLDRDRSWDRLASKRCDVIITNSAFTGDHVRKLFDVEPVVCHLGIPLEPEADYVHGDYAAVLTSFRPAKNVRNVIRAVAAAVRDYGIDDLMLRIAGQGPDRSRLEAEARDMGVEDRVRFTGLLPDAELPAFLAGARMLVYCPVDEPFGLVPIEALARKTPVIASNHGGPLETVEHGVTGLHVNPFDPASIAGALVELWRDEARTRALGEAGCARVREYFTLDAFVKRFEKIAVNHA